MGERSFRAGFVRAGASTSMPMPETARGPMAEMPSTKLSARPRRSFPWVILSRAPRAMKTVRMSRMIWLTLLWSMVSTAVSH